MTKQDILKKCIVKGNVITLPSGIWDMRTFLDVCDDLKSIGGVWRMRPVLGFVFEKDPTILLKELYTKK